MHNLADSRLAAYIQSTRFFLYLPFQIKAAKLNNYSFVEIRLQISCQITKPCKNDLYAALGIADIWGGESDFRCLEFQAKEYYHF